MAGILQRFLRFSLFFHFIVHLTHLNLAHSSSTNVLNCHDHSAQDSICTLEIQEIRPTQLTIGIWEVQSKVKMIQTELSKGHSIEELKLKEPEPTVIGPDHQFFIVDHHHFAVALLDIGEKKTLAKIIANYSSLSWDEFWEKMIKNKWIYPYNENGKEVSIDQIPKHLAQLKDDPYRSLAWLVRIHQGYHKTDIPFADFEWANYFRDKIKLPLDSTTYTDKKAWDSALKKALSLSKSSKASHLPGYNGY